MNSDFSISTDVTRKLAESIASISPQPMISKAIIEADRKSQELIDQISETARERDARENAKLEALQETAKETREIRERQDKIIDNQQLLIEHQRDQIAVLSKQLHVLEELFASGEDGVAAQEEIMQLLIDQENEKHPIGDYLADKAGDLGVAAITAATPLVWSGIKGWLATKGIMIP